MTPRPAKVRPDNPATFNYTQTHVGTVALKQGDPVRKQERRSVLETFLAVTAGWGRATDT